MTKNEHIDYENNNDLLTVFNMFSIEWRKTENISNKEWDWEHQWMEPIKISKIEKESLTDKLDFYDKSIDVVLKTIENNVANTNPRMKMLDELIKKSNKIAFDPCIRILFYLINFF
jgi:hypothetical protein